LKDLQFFKKQKIVGWGGAFTDGNIFCVLNLMNEFIYITIVITAVGFNLEKLPHKLQENLIKDYYGSDGLMYTMGRIPVGGTDFSVRPYTYDDVPNDESLSKFALQPADLIRKIPFIKMAEKEAGKLKLFSSLW